MLLEVANLSAFYGDLQTLHGVNLNVDAGESVALVGANGAGKTTFMRCLAGLIEHKRGTIKFGDSDISRLPAETIARRGIALTPEGRMLFPSLNVEENLLMGGIGRRPGYWNLKSIYRLFPLLAERRLQMPNTLSGGQQGLVAIARALMANPSLLLCDEISLGLAPVAVDQIYAAFVRFASREPQSFWSSRTSNAHRRRPIGFIAFWKGELPLKGEVARLIQTSSLALTSVLEPHHGDCLER